MITRLSLLLTGGALGGLANGLVVWIFGLLGITALFGVAIAPGLTPGLLYAKVAWGGIWGLIFLLPVLDGRWIARGLLFSLGPSLVQCLVVFPFKADAGFLGLQLGLLTPVFVLLFNAVWGVVTAWWAESLADSRPRLR